MTTATSDTASTTTTAIVPGSPEHDAAMAARWAESKAGDAPAPSALAAPTRPEGVPEKFWDAATGQVNTEALLKSYAELERARAKTGEQPAHQDQRAPDDAAARDAVNAAGLDWTSLQQKIVTKGALDEADFAALAKAGVPREIVEGHVELVAQRAEAERKEAINYLGGEKAAQAALQWAAQNLSEQEKAGINRLLASPDWRIGMDALKAKMGVAARTAGEPEATAFGTAPGTAAGYRSRADMKADMASPKYRADPAFREQVAQKMRSASWDLDR